MASSWIFFFHHQFSLSSPLLSPLGKRPLFWSGLVPSVHWQSLALRQRTNLLVSTVFLPLPDRLSGLPPPPSLPVLASRRRARHPRLRMKIQSLDPQPRPMVVEKWPRVCRCSPIFSLFSACSDLRVGATFDAAFTHLQLAYGAVRTPLRKLDPTLPERKIDKAAAYCKFCRVHDIFWVSSNKTVPTLRDHRGRKERHRSSFWSYNWRFSGPRPPTSSFQCS